VSKKQRKISSLAEKNSLAGSLVSRGITVYPTYILVWYVFWVLGFDAFLYRVCAFERDVYICVFKKTGKLSDFGGCGMQILPIFLFSSFV